MELARRVPTAERTVVGSGAVATSILPRREENPPIEIVIPLDGVVAAPGERMAVSIAVENRCADARGPGLLYDALGFASAVRFAAAPPAVPPPTTTTTTAPPPPPTTTTLPWPAGCLFQPLTGYDAVFCRLDTMADVLTDEDVTTFGSPATQARFQRPVGRSRDLVAVAQSGRRVPRHLRRSLQHLGVITRMLQRGTRQGRLDPDVSGELAELVSEAVYAIGVLR